MLTHRSVWHWKRGQQKVEGAGRRANMRASYPQLKQTGSWPRTSARGENAQPCSGKLIATQDTQTMFYYAILHTEA
jgi:hypothetical protein